VSSFRLRQHEKLHSPTSLKCTLCPPGEGQQKTYKLLRYLRSHQRRKHGVTCATSAASFTAVVAAEPALLTGFGDSVDDAALDALLGRLLNDAEEPVIARELST